MNDQTSLTEFLQFLNQSPTAYHAIASAKELLHDFRPLQESEDWHLEPGGSYYVTRNDSSLLAFRMPETDSVKGYLMAAAHSDSPVFKIKPNPELVEQGAYLRLNTEKYGGMLTAPWLDRPLSIAGRVLFSGKDDSIRSALVDLKKPVAVIPNLAIHMNRQANEGVSYNPQTHLLPLIGGAEAKGLLEEAIRNAIVNEDATVNGDTTVNGNIDASDTAPTILGTDLFLYNAMPAQAAGIRDELILSRSLDDLQCVWSLLQGLLAAPAHPSHITMCCIFDNEEVGSSTRQGADSTFLSDTLERIADCCGFSTAKQKQLLANSFLLSADNAHAIHPAYPEKADPTNRPVLNGGVVLKFNANQKYTTDGVSEAIVRTLCKRAEIPLQTYVNRSDIPGGSTLGNISTAHVSVRSADIGLPMLAMHSPYETAGVQDTEDLIKLMTVYYESDELFCENYVFRCF